MSLMRQEPRLSYERTYKITRQTTEWSEHAIAITSNNRTRMFSNIYVTSIHIKNRGTIALLTKQKMNNTLRCTSSADTIYIL